MALAAEDFRTEGGHQVITSATGDRENFVIATPTKCGASTVDRLSERYGGGRVSRGGEQLPGFLKAGGPCANDTTFLVGPRRKHRMTIPIGFEDAPRYLVVRNPFARYLSMYTYLRMPSMYSQWGSREVNRGEWGGWAMGRNGFPGDPMSFDEFLLFLAQERSDWVQNNRRDSVLQTRAYRSPWVWLDSLCDSARFLSDQPGWSSGEVRLIRLEDGLLKQLCGLAGMHGIDLGKPWGIHDNPSSLAGLRGVPGVGKRFELQIGSGRGGLQEAWGFACSECLSGLEISLEVVRRGGVSVGGGGDSSASGEGVARAGFQVWRGESADRGAANVGAAVGDYGCAGCAVSVVQEAAGIGYMG